MPPLPTILTTRRRQTPRPRLTVAAFGVLLWIVATVVLLFVTTPRAVAQEPVPVPGQREIYVGSVSQFSGPGATAQEGQPRLGVVRLEVGDGLLSGRLLFPADESGADEMRAECQGFIDIATGRGLLKVRWIDPNAPPNALPMPSEKMSVLLKRGVLTGGTMGSDGGVLAFRSERAFVILP